MGAPLTEITAILRDVLRDTNLELTLATRFDDLNSWDSMDLITVAVEAECRFNLQFDPAEIDRLTSVADLLHLIAAKQAQATA